MLRFENTVLRSISTEGYFVPENAFDLPAGSEFHPEIVNLALVLNMFLPKSVRRTYKNFANQIPLVDDGDLNGETESAIDEKLSDFATPLSDFKLVYLKLCAGRSDKHIQWVVRQLIMDLCTTVRLHSLESRDGNSALSFNFGRNPILIHQPFLSAFKS